MWELMRVPPGSKVEATEDGLGVIAFLPDGSCEMARLRFNLRYGTVIERASVPKVVIGLGGTN